MLGTNDLKSRFKLSAFAIAQGAAELLQLVQKFKPEIGELLLISPPHIVETDNIENTLAFEGAIEKSKLLARHYSDSSDKFDYHFLDAAAIAKSSPLDGIHLDAHAHLQLAEGVCVEVNRIFRDRL